MLQIIRTMVLDLVQAQIHTVARTTIINNSYGIYIVTGVKTIPSQTTTV